MAASSTKEHGDPVAVTKELLLEWIKDPTLFKTGFLMGKEVWLHHVSGLIAYYRFEHNDNHYELPYRWCACGRSGCGAPQMRSLESGVYDALEIIDDDDVVYARQ
jgi:hypothetical protein